MNADSLRATIAQRYGQTAIAFENKSGGSCCGSGSSCCGGDSTSHFADDYSKIDGYAPQADLSLGCGLPTEIADIKPGQIVLDLGSGAGNDVFIARRLVGDSGKVIGVDMTPEMIRLARKNADTLGYDNVKFLLGEIEALPLAPESVDVVVSNCVLNLVPEKAAAFSEMYRVIKPGGHFSISDIVSDGDLPEGIRSHLELWAGCVSGAQKREDYLAGLEAVGFSGIEVRKEKPIRVPDEMVFEALGEELGKAFLESGARLSSITVFGKKSDV